MTNTFLSNNSVLKQKKKDVVNQYSCTEAARILLTVEMLVHELPTHVIQQLFIVVKSFLLYLKGS